MSNFPVALERGRKVKSVAAWMGRGEVPTQPASRGGLGRGHPLHPPAPRRGGRDRHALDPGLDGPVARRVIRHMQYRPRITAATLKAFDDAVELLLEQQKLRTRVTSQSCDGRFIREVLGEHPELFADLPPAC